MWAEGWLFQFKTTFLIGWVASYVNIHVACHRWQGSPLALETWVKSVKITVWECQLQSSLNFNDSLITFLNIFIFSRGHCSDTLKIWMNWISLLMVSILYMYHYLKVLFLLHQTSMGDTLWAIALDKVNFWGWCFCNFTSWTPWWCLRNTEYILC